MTRNVSKKPERLTFALSVSIKICFIFDGMKNFINAAVRKIKMFILKHISK
jgi:hypothetical protein